jgi:hypothetical protein
MSGIDGSIGMLYSSSRREATFTKIFPRLFWGLLLVGNAVDWNDS